MKLSPENARDLNFSNYNHNIKQLMCFTGFIKE